MKKNFQFEKVQSHIEKRINDMNKKISGAGRNSQAFTNQSNEKILEQESVVLGKK